MLHIYGEFCSFMSLVQNALNFIIRFRYPGSLPQEIASALGIEIKSTIRFRKMLDQVIKPHHPPTTLRKFMPREKAEKAFENALRKEYFGQNSLFSFYFPEGWMEFELQFDDTSRLRRLFVHHKLISNPHGYEIPLLIEE